jgi:broad specificity phosphatase PhoE
MVEIHVRHGQASAETNWGLTPEGRRQAEAAATYLRTHFPQALRVGTHSGLRRAKETAQILNADIAWTEDARLVEADWQGRPEPREFTPWRGMFDRVAAACADLGTLDAENDRIVVSHGGTLRMVRAYHEGLVGSRYSRMYEEPYKYFNNCQIIIYSDTHPDTGITEQGSLWVKSVCPWDEGRFGHDWMVVGRG